MPQDIARVLLPYSSQLPRDRSPDTDGASGYRIRIVTLIKYCLGRRSFKHTLYVLTHLILTTALRLCLDDLYNWGNRDAGRSRWKANNRQCLDFHNWTLSPHPTDSNTVWVLIVLPGMWGWRKVGMVVNTCNPTTWDVEAGRSGVQGQP